MTQEEALDILKMGHNVFLTGQAGSGKTYLLNQYISYLKQLNIGVAVTASTGISATHMGGTTIHSWAGIGIKDSMTPKELRGLLRKRNLSERVQKTNVLIIDEISMLHSYRLDLVETVVRMMKGNFEPFGGMQVVLCGDFFQLPPVTKEGNPADYFAFKSSSWDGMDIRVCYLETQYRQTDREYSTVLNEIRADAVHQGTIETLRKRYQASFGGRKITKLYTHNSDVDAINDYELSRLPGEAKHFYMQSRGVEKLIKELKRNCLAPEDLMLKEKAVVIFVKNNFNRGYVNGTMGVVEGFDEYGNPVVKTNKGDVITALPESWRFEEDSRVVAEISQVPLRLAWAITVHKSQGMSLDAAEVDLSKTFEAGMGYVALSRIRELRGLRLMGLNDLALKIHPEVFEVDQQFVNLSKKEAGNLRNLSTSEIQNLHKIFIEKIKPDKPNKPVKSYSVEDVRKIDAKAYEKWTEEEDERLKKDVHAGRDIGTLAAFFGRNKGAIRSRLKKLGIIKK